MSKDAVVARLGCKVIQRARNISEQKGSESNTV